MTSLSESFLRFHGILKSMRYTKNSGGFRLTEKEGLIFLQHYQMLTDVIEDGEEVREQRGRKWYISPHMTEGEFIQTALMAVIAFEEHEAREAFTFRHKRIFSPHKSVQSLMVVQEEKRQEI